jgi:DNA-binding MarR family transcriptional regulator
MGRHKLPIDDMAVLEMRSQGKSVKEIAETVNVSTATLSRHIAELQNQQGILTKYRQLQGLQLTELQHQILEAITPEKIAEASLLDLVKSLKNLIDAGAAIQGKDSLKIIGLVGYLLEIERREKESS